MEFRKIIKLISGTVAMAIVFMMACGMYFSFKGYVSDGKGGFMLVKNANAAGPDVKELIVPPTFMYPDTPAKGNHDAKVTLYEVSSFGCYYCAEFHNKTMPLIEEHFVKTGKLRVVFAPFPLDRTSMMAQMMGMCLPEGKFFDFADKVFANQKKWQLSSDAKALISEYAQENGLESSKIEECLKNSKMAQDIIAFRQSAMETLKIKGTPTIVLVKNGKSEVMEGAVPFDELKAKIEKKLNEN